MAEWRLKYLKDSDNLAKRASLSVGFPSDYPATSQEDTDFPITNAQKLPVSKPARILNYTPANTSATYGMVINVVFQGATTIDFIALVGHNITSSATITIFGGTSFPAATSLGTATWRAGTVFKVFSSDQSYTHFKISVLDESNTEGFLQLGYLILGKLSELSYGQYDYELTDSYDTSKLITETGIPIGGVSGDSDQSLTLTYRNRSISECDTLRTVFKQIRGSNEPVFLIPSSSENDGIFGRISDSVENSFSAGKGTGLTNFSVEIRSEKDGKAVVAELPRAGVFEDMSDWTFTRSATAYYKNSQLQLVQAASGEMRSEHYFDYGKPCILLEQAIYNRLLYSEDMTSLNWTRTGLDYTANATDEPKASPSTTADLIYEDTSTGDHSIYQAIAGSLQTDNLPYSLSVFLKAAGRTRVRVYGMKKDGTTAYALVDLSSGTIVSYSDNTILEAFVERYYDGWWRVCAHVKNVGTGANTPYLAVYLVESGDTASYEGDGSSGVYMWGAQINPNVVASTSYIATAGSVAASGADSLYRSMSLIQKAVTIYFSYYRVESTANYNSGFYFCFGVSGSNSDPRLLVYHVSSSGRAIFQLGVTSGGGSDRTCYPISTAEMALIPLGGFIELLLQASPAGGIRAYGYVDGNEYASSPSFTAVNPFDPTEMTRVVIGANPTLTGSVATSLHFSKLRTVRGVQSIDYMRSLK